MADVQEAVRFCRPLGRVTAIGYSLGGRLSLLAGADHCIAISPSLSRYYSDKTQEMLKAMRSHRVRPSDLGPLLAMQDQLPVWSGGKHPGQNLLIVGERDVPEILEGCKALGEKGVPVVEVPKALHSDTFMMERTFGAVREKIREWYDRS